MKTMIKLQVTSGRHRHSLRARAVARADRNLLDAELAVLARRLLDMLVSVDKVDDFMSMFCIFAAQDTADNKIPPLE